MNYTTKYQMEVSAISNGTQVHHMSDLFGNERTEFAIKDRLSFMRFLGLTLKDSVPGEKTIWLFRETLLETRPIYHKCDDTIRGHVFCSFLALLMRKELEDRLEGNGYSLEWADIVRDLDGLVEMELHAGDKRYRLRSESKPTTTKVFQSCGVALPPSIRQVQ